MANPFDGNGNDAFYAVLTRGQVIIASLENLLRDMDSEPRRIRPHEFTEIIEGVGVFAHLALMCKTVTEGTITG